MFVRTARAFPRFGVRCKASATIEAVGPAEGAITRNLDAVFAGATTYFTPKAHVLCTLDAEPIPCFRVLNPNGTPVNGAEIPNVAKDVMVTWYKEMVTVSTLDRVLYDMHRQGRISFYAGNFGEEATHIGSASALDSDDIVYSQYREIGVLLHRGYTLPDFINQCMSNIHGHGKGRQVPVHYGSPELKFHTVSSPLATQMPQASGAGYAVRNTGNCVICFFGEGAASEGDAHAAFNFAATLDCPIIFFCRNNGYAISTPAAEQYRGDGIASRAAGYGMDVIRVDGNDVLAVHVATAKARESAVSNSRPVIVEALTYRGGDHSTSDDASAYRPDEEVEHFNAQNPIDRMLKYLIQEGYYTREEDEAHRTSVLDEIRSIVRVAEKEPLPSIDSLFEDVLEPMAPHLAAQQQQLRDHLALYRHEYPTSRRLD